MKYNYIYYLTISFLTLLSVNKQSLIAQNKGGLYIDFDVAKSVNHLLSGGYSFDIEGYYMFPNQLALGLSYGNTKFFDKTNSEKNIADYQVKGAYFKPELLYFLDLDLDGDIYIFIGGAAIFSQFDESLHPFIPGNYFGNYKGELLKRSGMSVAGGELICGLWFYVNSRLSFMFNGRLGVVEEPVMPENELLDSLPVQYIPGLGRVDESQMSGGLSLKLVFKLF